MSRAHPGSRLALTLRRLRGRFGIAAPKVTVRTHVPWYLRLASIAGLVALLAMLAGWSYDAGLKIAGFNRGETDHVVRELRQANLALEEEVVRLRSLLAANESSLQIEQSSQKLLAEQNAALALENARLKEDIAVFDRLAKLEGRTGEQVAIDRLAVRAEGPPGQYRYGFLISLQGARRGKESAFDLQIVAFPRSGVEGDKIVLPQGGASNAEQYRIVLRNFRRIEGRFAVPPNFQIGRLEIRISERGTLMTSGSISL